MPLSTPEERWRAANEAEEYRKKPQATTTSRAGDALFGVNAAGIRISAQDG